MELDGNSLLLIADEQETGVMELNTSTGIDLLSQCQTHEVEGAVVMICICYPFYLLLRLKNFISSIFLELAYC